MKEFNALEYWKEKLREAKNSERLIHDYYDDTTYKKKNYSMLIDKKSGTQLSKICRNNKFLVYVFLVSTLKINLSKYMFKKNVTVGIPYYNSESRKKIIYSKVLPLTTCIDYEKTYLEYMMSIKEQILEIYKNQDYLNSMVLLQNNVANDVKLTPITICMKNLHQEKYINYICNSSKNEISFLFEILRDNSIKLDVVYNARNFSKVTIENLTKSCSHILNEVLNDYNQKIKDIKILSEKEINQILYEFNNTKYDYNKDRTIQELFEEQVEKTPNNIAIVFEDKRLTYKELNEKSNQLARILRNKGVKSDSIVGIMIERSLEMIIGIMAILKSGGAYLPIEPNHTKKRIEYMLKDCESKILLSTESLLDCIDFNGKSINLFKENLYEGDSSDLEKINNSSDLVYVIYTSGTTGIPKGVMIEHRSLSNLILGLKKNIYQRYDKFLRIGLVSPYYFDASIKQIFASILNGHCLYIISEDIRKDGGELIKYYEKNKIEIADGTPMHMKMMLNSKLFKKNNLEIKQYIIGGEALSLNTIKGFYQDLGTFDKPYISNVYGPTECCVDSSIYLIEPQKVNNSTKILIGKPMVNCQIYILDIYNNVIPIGMPGELCISGDGLARGYINQPKLTAEKFVENPFESGTKMYKTGDLARWMPDGNIELLGRIDNQVKIRGFRIELGEIENRLLQHVDVKEAAIVLKKSKENEKYICAYVVSEREISDLNLKSYLKESLPEYMIPAYFVQLDVMPLTSNGKLYRKALPEPNVASNLNEYEAPRNEVEHKLAKIWSEILDIEKVGINDNFFDLGGHSLKAMVLMSKIHKELNREIPLKELFRSPTIKDLCKFIGNAEKNPYSTIDNVEEKEYYEASSAQKRMYILQQLNKDSVAYNMPATFELEGKVDKIKIEETFKKLVIRHEALRTYFGTIEGQIVQKISNSDKFKLVDRKENEEIETIIDKFVRKFDLENEPLFRVELVEIREKTYLLIDMHHIISDGVSMSILIRELTDLYNGKSFEPLKLEYKDFATWQNRFLKSGEMKKQEEYWINKFNSETPILNLPYDYERPAMQSFEGDNVRFEVDEKTTEELRKLAKETGTTMHMVLLSAFNILLSKYSGQEDIVIGTPIAGRPHSDLQNIMGIFVNVLALGNKPSGDKKYLDFLKEVRENSLKAYENQSYQLEVLVDKLNIRRDRSRNPLFDVMFNMIDTLTGSDIKLEGLLLKYHNNENKGCKFELTLNALERDNSIELNIEYCSKLFNKETIERIGTHYIRILDNITSNNKIKIDEIELLTEAESNQLQFEFNDTKVDQPKDKTIH